MNNVTEIYRSKAHRHYCINRLAERRAAERAMRIADKLIEQETFEQLLADARREARDERS